MAWRVRMKLRKAPPGVELISDKLEEFEQRMREALNAPMDDKRRNELSWPMHKIHYEKNRYLHDMHYKEHAISKKLLDYLVKEKLCDGKLIAKWRKQGYERLCSLLAITKSNTNFRTVSVCRTPLRDRTGQIMPNVMTGCVSCASGDGGPIWWDDPVPDIVKRRNAAIDPGKQEIVDRAKRLRDATPPATEAAHAGGADEGDGVEEEILNAPGGSVKACRICRMVYPPLLVKRISGKMQTLTRRF